MYALGTISLYWVMFFPVLNVIVLSRSWWTIDCGHRGLHCPTFLARQCSPIYGQRPEITPDFTARNVPLMMGHFLFPASIPWSKGNWLQRNEYPCSFGIYQIGLSLKHLLLNLFIYQARESSLVPLGFLTAQFLQKLWFIKPLFWWGGYMVVLLLINFLEERECEEKKQKCFHFLDL